MPNAVNQVFVDARELVRRYGWIQFRTGSLSEGYCLVGAVVKASRPGTQDSVAGAEAYKVLQKLTEEDAPHEWNDYPGRTQEQVLELLDLAIEVTK